MKRESKRERVSTFISQYKTQETNIQWSWKKLDVTYVHTPYLDYKMTTIYLEVYSR